MLRDGRRVRGRVLAQLPDKDGSPEVKIGVRSVAVHQLVMLAFRGLCPAGMEVLHGDDDRVNPRLASLRYGRTQRTRPTSAVTGPPT